MSRNRQFSLRLTKRDLELFSYLFCLKGAARHQINRDIFCNVSQGVLHDRLFKLSRYGYLEKRLCDYHGSRTCYYVTKKALEALDLSEESLERRELKSSSPHHDFFLVDVRRKLLSAQGLVQYLTENQLQSMSFNDMGFNYQCFRELHSDAFLRVKIGDGEFSGAIEYEQSNKGRGRYEPLFHNYYLSENIAFVFYICSSLAFQKTLMEVEKDIRGKRDPKLFFVPEQQFLNESSTMTFTNLDVHKIDIPLKKSVEAKNATRCT